jgi:hypothetical protein
MEWVLQVIDEIDDAIGAMRLGWLGIAAPIGALMSSVGAAFTIRGRAALILRGRGVRAQS